ncbi:MAG: hypothetical protein QOF02_812 [Blastocatellia bacterium]|jgi:hypothetical protein|nr:hypothetical protein [Blastocatellia bacterium]
MKDARPNIHQRLNEVLARIEPTALQESVSDLFSRLIDLLDLLHLLESCLKADDTLVNSPIIFKSLHEKAKELIATIEGQAKHAEGISATLDGLYDSTIFAFQHELKRVRNFIVLNPEHSTEQVRTEFARAHGLLRNCTQQTIISISVIFDSSLTGDQLFDDFKLKLEQSVVLCEALTILIERVNRAESQRDLDSYFALMEAMTMFESFMSYLMFRDWAEVQRFMDELTTARTEFQLWPQLKQFAAYLDTLHCHVRMRSVLHNHPLQQSTVISK